MPELPLVGDEFAGYRMRGVLGRGGMSVVYQAENLRLDDLIALKVLAPELATDDVFRARFLEESRIAASLNHPNVIPIYDMGSSDGCPVRRLRRPGRPAELRPVPAEFPGLRPGADCRRGQLESPVPAPENLFSRAIEFGKADR